MKPNILIVSLGCLMVWQSFLFGQENDETISRNSRQGSKQVASADKANQSEKNFIGFVDENNDGINDRFYDANGDGKNDVDNKDYPHKFEYKDNNKDKINDLWVDQDGDGVNDLSSKFNEEQRKERDKNVLDSNEDDRNDITGEKLDREKYLWRGEKWGFWNEEKGKLQGRFIDEDGDGIDDRIKDFDAYVHRHEQGGRMRDRFIDEDGDGICDDRSDFINRMGRRGRHGRNRGDKDGGGH